MLAAGFQLYEIHLCQNQVVVIITYLISRRYPQMPAIIWRLSCRCIYWGRYASSMVAVSTLSVLNPDTVFELFPAHVWLRLAYQTSTQLAERCYASVVIVKYIVLDIIRRRCFLCCNRTKRREEKRLHMCQRNEKKEGNIYSRVAWWTIRTRRSKTVILTLLATCRRSRRFHGHNAIC